MSCGERREVPPRRKGEGTTRDDKARGVNSPEMSTQPLYASAPSQSHRRSHPLSGSEGDDGDRYGTSVAPDGTVYKKPDEHYMTMLTRAILESERKMLSLADIYAWVRDRYPYYNYANNSWANCVRHNLSMNDCFIKNERGPNDRGKGCLWSVDARCVPSLLDGTYKRKSGSGSHRKRK